MHGQQFVAAAVVQERDGNDFNHCDSWGNEEKYQIWEVFWKSH